MARHDEFNREMNAYLRQRVVVKRSNPLLAAKNYFATMFAKKEDPAEKPLDIPQEEVEAVLHGHTINKRPTSIRPATAAPQKVSKMGWFSKKREEDYEDMDAQTMAAPQVDEDVKEVLKITFKWLKMMDPDTVEEIKRSPDFEKYKRVLDKYGLIKK